MDMRTLVKVSSVFGLEVVSALDRYCNKDKSWEDKPLSVSEIVELSTTMMVDMLVANEVINGEQGKSELVELLEMEGFEKSVEHTLQEVISMMEYI